MKALTSFSLLALARTALGHGNHGPGPNEGETIQQYAQRHMSTEHHIDSFDIPSFFQLHDLNRDGFWDRAEIEAVYGVHHVYAQMKSKDDIEHQKKADYIVDTILKRLDTNGDGKISLDELQRAGLDALPNFQDMGADGHHYDVESEFFLHHEEQFHSTPETQTDESYTHPEDIEHFAHHEQIERKEAEREAKYQGITVEEALAAHNPDTHPEEHANDAGQAPNDSSNIPTVGKPKGPRLTPPEKLAPRVKYEGASSEGRAKPEWGSGEEGYKPPTAASDKLRKNLPYKYKFRRNWGDF